jgi:copper chaperone
MKKKYFIEGMSCGSCVAKVKAALLKVEGVEFAEVQLQFPQATIKMEGEVPVTKLQSALSDAGHYHIKEAENEPEFNDKKARKGCCC